VGGVLFGAGLFFATAFDFVATFAFAIGFFLVLEATFAFCATFFVVAGLWALLLLFGFLGGAFFLAIVAV
jgi:hypothetical protein